jgi:hypothetical protein
LGASLQRIQKDKLLRIFDFFLFSIRFQKQAFQTLLIQDYSLALVFPVEFRFKEYKKLSCFASLTFFVFNTLSKASFWRA